VKNNFDSKVLDPECNSGPNGKWRCSVSSNIVYPITGWVVWYADGRYVRSTDVIWEELPPTGVQVIMLQHANGRRSRLANCDEYKILGETRTLLGLMIEFSEYERISMEAMNDSWRATP
jgi:hypothetical protein